jgi:streptogramin lyase
MVQAPNGNFYHAHYSDSIQQLGMQSGQSVVLQTFPQTDVVGMASDGVSIWITNWGAGQVGTWDPTTNVFTPVFSTPSSAGGLAWDVANGVLWVGMSGGSVIPYDATGKQLGAGFQPFGNIGGANTVDGLAFVP